MVDFSFQSPFNINIKHNMKIYIIVYSLYNFRIFVCAIKCVGLLMLIIITLYT